MTPTASTRAALTHPRCRSLWRAALAVILPVMAAMAAASAGAAVKDPLDFPAAKVGALSSRPLLAVARSGARLVAVGSRGVAILSDDEGKTWEQAAVPVQSDLVAVHFPTPTDGWAVGHDGVILHSADGGRNWQKQLDGRAALASFSRYYNEKGASQGEAMRAVEKNYGSGPSLPLLDVWFQDSQTGYAVGAFGILVATRDGGRTWEPWFERIDNPDMLNLNGVRGVGGQLFIAAERGVVFRYDAASGRFVKSETGYGGSFFGIVGSDKAVVAYGLRGSVYRSGDAGRTWSAIATGSESTISAGLLDDKGSLVLVNVAGEVLVGDPDGDGLTVRAGWSGARASGVAVLADGKYLISSPAGLRIQAAQ